jgi:cyclopropane fatty-acyl-phospholipid synthase-like methyltransferase
MIDSSKIKEFWDNRAIKASELRVEGVANLEENSELLDQKVQAEYKKIMEWVKLTQNISTILDLGSGAGQWSFRFAKVAKKVVVVEYSRGMLDLAIEGGKKQQFSNIEFIQKPAQDYISMDRYDLIWISGLLIYLNDDECESLINNCASMLTEKGMLLLRDGTGIKNRHEINNEYSKDLKSFYSACYRTTSEYIALFAKYGFKLARDEDMFQEESRLNKWKETRLRVYEFRLSNN